MTNYHRAQSASKEGAKWGWNNLIRGRLRWRAGLDNCIGYIWGSIGRHGG